MAKEIISLARGNKEFRYEIYGECLKQVRGDYNVSIDKVLQLAKSKNIFSANQLKEAEKTFSEMLKLQPGRMPIIFIPSMETFENKLRKDKKQIQARAIPESQLEEIIGVPGDGGGGGSGDTAPGYIWENGSWNFFAMINEEYAWNNDIWVIGYEEEVSPENMVPNPADTVTFGGRFSGVGEYSRIQLSSMTAEPWRSGKMEFKFFVNGANGTLLKELPLGKWRRENFRNQRWHDFGLRAFIGFWRPNEPNWGNITFERWIEEDGGNSSEISQTVTVPGQNGGPSSSLTIKHPSKNRDDNLGLFNVQFLDPISATYTLQDSYIQRFNR
ncbi:MAG: hypothetical protein K2W79_02670 [Hydrotalea flava]|nr:hypothetical protein [Hydrotalea flava]